MTDIEYGKKFGGIVTLEFIEDLTNEDIKDIFFYIMHNIQEWVKEKKNKNNTEG